MGCILPARMTLLYGAKGKQEPAQVEGTSMRAIISFPSFTFLTLENMVCPQKVSLAQLVRESVKQCLADKWPLPSGLREE
jgi:hypothetical protein